MGFARQSVLAMFHRNGWCFQFLVLATGFAWMGVPVLGCATGPSVPKEEPAPLSRLVIRNHTTDACNLYLRGRYLEKLPPASACWIRNLPATPFHVSVTCGAETHEFSVSQPEMVVLDIPGEADELTDVTAALVIHNPSPFDVRILLDQDVLGTVFAHGSAVFETLPVGTREMTVRSVKNVGEWKTPLTLESMQTTYHEISAPVARLKITNDTEESVELVALGEDKVQLKARQSLLLQELPPGDFELKIWFIESHRELSLPVSVGPSEDKEISISSQAGRLSVENRLKEFLDVYYRGECVGQVKPGNAHLVQGVPAGKTVLKLKSEEGREYEHEFVVTPGSSETWIVDERDTVLRVRNLVGERVQLYIDGDLSLELHPLERVRFGMEPGFHVLSTYCPLTGHTQKQKMKLGGGGIIPVNLGPQNGRLRVENRTNETLRLFRNGHPLSAIGPGVIVEYSAQPLGTSLIEGFNEEKALVLREEVEIRSSKNEASPLVVSTTQVKINVRNETGEPVEVEPDVHAESRILEPDTEALLEVPGLTGVVKFKGVHSGLRYDQMIQGKAGQTLDITLESVVGGIALQNTTDHEVEVHLDGKPFSTLGPGKEAIEPKVAPGEHRLTAYSKGQKVDEVKCLLLEHSWYVWEIAVPIGALKIYNHTTESLLLRVEDAEAGVLHAGAATRFDNLPQRPVSVTAVGLESRHAFRYSFTPVDKDLVVWQIRPMSGGIQLFALGGEEATVFLDGILLRTVEKDEPEPIYIATSPGEHSVKVVLGDGTVFATLTVAGAGQFERVQVKDREPTIEVRNETDFTIQVLLDDRLLDSVVSGARLLVLLPDDEMHRVLVRTPDGSREWWLKDLYFPETARFGWSIRE